MSKLRVLSLFAGIGGFDLGLERTGGFETVAFCEIDKKAQRVLARHWPGVPIYDDVSTLTAEQLTADGVAVDVIVGGFPCQDISTAGLGAGIDGERSGLWADYARLIGELRPRFVIVENVSALLNRGLDRVLGSLASLGYDAWWDCIPAFAVGAPHRRDRIWIVGHPGSTAGQWNARAVSGAQEGERGPRQQYGHLPVGLEHAGASDRARDIPDAQSNGRRKGQPDGRGRDEGIAPRQERGLGNGGEALADADRKRGCSGPPRIEDAEDARQPSRRSQFGGWDFEPAVGRVAHGVPGRVDRLKQLGNAVVPQIPELIGRAILTARTPPSDPPRSST